MTNYTQCYGERQYLYFLATFLTHICFSIYVGKYKKANSDTYAIFTDAVVDQNVNPGLDNMCIAVQHKQKTELQDSITCNCSLWFHYVLDSLRLILRISGYNYILP